VNKNRALWTIAKYILLTLCGVVSFQAAHASATATRGYEAYGGEIFFLMLPLFYWLISSTVKDFMHEIKSVSQSNKNFKEGSTDDEHI